MKWMKFAFPYLLVSPAVLGVFFISMFICCVSVETAMHIMLQHMGILPIMSQHTQDIAVITLAGPVAMFISALFMNKAVYEVRCMVSFNN